MLSLIIFLPIVFCLALIPFKNEKLIRYLSLFFSLAHFALCCLLLVKFDKNSAALQLVEQHDWLPEVGSSYFVGIDGISIWLVVLTSFLSPLVILGSWTSITKKVKSYHVFLMVLQSAMIGSFLSIDALLFYVFFELSLIPMYFIVGIWGGENRLYATMKFFIYTMVGSLLMLGALVYLILQTHSQLGYLSSNLLDLYQLNIPFVAGQLLNPQCLLFIAFCMAFAIKVPMFPFHTWLPDAHVQAPTGGSIILAGVMLKMGTYGFMRFVLPMFPEAVDAYAWVFLLLGLFGIIYGALVAMVQTDIKKLVAYSSVSHMGYVVVGLFAQNMYGYTGGLFQMLAHGISTGALFLLVGIIYERTHSREISKYGGLASVAPWFTIMFFIVTFSSIAVPMTNGFVGEFLILMGLFKANHLMGYVAVTGVVLGASYMLWMAKKVFFGEKGELCSDDHHPILDLNTREFVALIPFVIAIFTMGLVPKIYLSYTEKSIAHLNENLKNYQLEIYEQVQKVSSHQE